MLQRGHGQVGRLREQRDLRCLHDLCHEELQFMRLTLRGATMTKADLVEEVANATGLTKRDVGVVVDLVLETISKALSDQEHIELRGFGSFKVKTRKARIARNPRTGERVNVPEKLVPYFKASRELVKLVDSAQRI